MMGKVDSLVRLNYPFHSLLYWYTLAITAVPNPPHSRIFLRPSLGFRCSISILHTDNLSLFS